MSRARSFWLAFRIIIAITGAATPAKPVGRPRLRSVISQLSYQAGTLSGSAAYVETSSGGRRITIFVTTSTSAITGSSLVGPFGPATRLCRYGTDSRGKGALPGPSERSEMSLARNRNGLTVKEYLFLLAVLVFLAIILVPNFLRANRQGSGTACKTNLRNIGIACEMYSTDWLLYPPSTALLTPNYLKTIPECPVSESDTYSEHYRLELVKPGVVVCPTHKGDENPVCRAKREALAEQLGNEQTAMRRFKAMPQEEVSCPEGEPYRFEAPEITYHISCWGDNHTDMGLPPNYPMYDGINGLIER